MAWNGSDQSFQSAREVTRSTGKPRRAPVSGAQSPCGRDCPNRVAKGRNPSIVHLFSRPIFYLILLVVSLIGVAIYFVFFGRDGARPSPVPIAQRHAQIATVAPAAARTNAAPVAVTNGAPAKRKRVFKTYRDEKGVLRYEGGMVVRKPPVRTIKVGDHTPSIFKHVAEMQISHLLKIEPGQMVVGTMIYDKNFTDSLKESFKDEIVINPDDDEKTREIKQAVIDTKKELKERMDRGEDVCKLMSDTRKDLQRLGLYRMDLEKQVNQVLEQKAADGNLSDKDVEDCYGAANSMLEEKGLTKLHMPGRMFVRAMRRSAEKRKARLEAQKKGTK